MGWGGNLHHVLFPGFCCAKCVHRRKKNLEMTGMFLLCLPKKSKFYLLWGKKFREILLGGMLSHY